MSRSFDSAPIRALTFDVFGTVVDWHGGIMGEGRKLARRVGLKAVDWDAFANAWRALYAPSMDKVRRGEWPWMKIDQLHRLALDQVLEQFGIQSLSAADKDQFNLAWHRLPPWPDSVKGLKRLKKRFTIATLSNGNVSLLVDMAKNAGLPWDCIFCSELIGRFKRDPECYLKAADWLSLRPEQVMMVAAHQDDLQAAQKLGLRTAFVLRPLEFGAKVKKDLRPDPAFHIVAKDFLDLADQVGA